MLEVGDGVGQDWGWTGMMSRQWLSLHYSPWQLGRTLAVNVLSQSDWSIDRIQLLVLSGSTLEGL